MTLGIILHALSKIVLVCASYAIHVYLGKALSPADYGVIGVIISMNNINYNFLSQGARQAASRTLAEKNYNEKDIIRKSILLQLAVTAVLFLANFLFADFYASILNAPGTAPYIRMTAFVVPAIAGYFLSLGVANGYRMFVPEALIMILYSAARLTVIPYVGYLFSDSAAGAVTGFFTASVSAFIAGVVIIIRIYKKADDLKPTIRCRTYLSHATSFLLFFVCIAVMLNLDLFFINAMTSNPSIVGYYTGAANFAKISYYLLTAIYAVALPVVTQKYGSGDIHGSVKIIKRLFSLILLFIAPVPCIAGPLAGNLMAGFYRPEYREAAFATGILMFSQFFIGLMVTLNIFLCAATSRKFSGVAAVCTLALDALMCWLLIPRFSITGAAVATLISGILGCTATAVKIRKVFPALWDKKLTTLLCANLLFSGLLAALSRFLVTDGLIPAVLMCAVAYMVFILIVWGLRIISPIKFVLSLKNREEL